MPSLWYHTPELHPLHGLEEVRRALDAPSGSEPRNLGQDPEACNRVSWGTHEPTSFYGRGRVNQLDERSTMSPL